jgi:PhnB protein
MIATAEAKVDKDLANKKITVTRHFKAEPETVWNAWTQREILDQWWAPKPWRAETKKLEFREGGSWLYDMVGPENERHHARVEYTKINASRSFEGTDSFADEKGVVNKDMPQTNWRCVFESSGSGTDVTVTITAKSREALEKMLEMGFEEGFKAALGNLDEYLERNG